MDNSNHEFYDDDTPVSTIWANAAQQRRPLTGRPDRVFMPKPRWATLTQEGRDNGGVAGADTRVIHRTDCKVDIMGIDNHMINDIYIGTAGGVVETHKGSVIAILNQYALMSKGRTIHAPGQLDFFGNNVNDKSTIIKGGLQRIITHDDYIIPITFDRGLPRLRLRPFTDDEFEKLPHVILTSTLEWDPAVLDFDPIEHENWFDALTEIESDTNTNLFDEFGEYRHRVVVQCNNFFNREVGEADDDIVDRCVYHAHSVGLSSIAGINLAFLDAHENEQFPADEENEVTPGVPIEPRTVTTKEPNYGALRPLFGLLSSDIIMKILQHTTQ